MTFWLRAILAFQAAMALLNLILFLTPPEHNPISLIAFFVCALVTATCFTLWRERL